MAERRFSSIGPGGLRWNSMPARLYQKGKRLAWDPQHIDFSHDAQDWARLNDAQRTALLRLAAGFGAGEEAVTLDLIPLIQVIAQERRLEEEMYLTQFLYEESRHVEGFRLWLDAVGASEDLHANHGPSYQKIFYQELPQAMNRLLSDPSPAAQAEAAVTYNMIVEGVLAETGYHVYRLVLSQHHIMPGMQKLVGLIATDESRHIGYGVYLLSRLMAENADLYPVVKARMNYLLPFAMGVYSDNQVPNRPFGLDQEEGRKFAARKFNARMAVIDRECQKSLEEIEYQPETVFEVEDEPWTP